MIEEQVLNVIYVRLQSCCFLLIEGTLLVSVMLALADLKAGLILLITKPCCP